HKDKGWELFTDRIIELLNEREEGVVFLLWGANAKAKAALITAPQHRILTAAHPSPMSAARGFFGCRHFSRANRILEQNGMEPIDWQIENI
ncbi:MAG TPA: uracil-DNA glycosylase, partial [Candidatus Aphodoplasma excrementigallinarum]|nr:uracil-DNA glycosylase [Candidatus Aphodoplasma excrementigallinarum]